MQTQTTQAMMTNPQPTLFTAAALPRQLPIMKQGPEDEPALMPAAPVPTRH